jgi:hypothetical protein
MLHLGDLYFYYVLLKIPITLSLIPEAFKAASVLAYVGNGVEHGAPSLQRYQFKRHKSITSTIKAK